MVPALADVDRDRVVTMAAALTGSPSPPAPPPPRAAAGAADTLAVLTSSDDGSPSMLDMGPRDTSPDADPAAAAPDPAARNVACTCTGVGIQQRHTNGRASHTHDRHTHAPTHTPQTTHAHTSTHTPTPHTTRAHSENPYPRPACGNTEPVHGHSPPTEHKRSLHAFPPCGHVAKLTRRSASTHAAASAGVPARNSRFLSQWMKNSSGSSGPEPPALAGASLGRWACGVGPTKHTHSHTQSHRHARARAPKQPSPSLHALPCADPWHTASGRILGSCSNCGGGER
jgi:hypothetical protein